MIFRLWVGHTSPNVLLTSSLVFPKRQGPGAQEVSACKPELFNSGYCNVVLISHAGISHARPKLSLGGSPTPGYFLKAKERPLRVLEWPQNSSNITPSHIYRALRSQVFLFGLSAASKAIMIRKGCDFSMAKQRVLADTYPFAQQPLLRTVTWPCLDYIGLSQQKLG